MTTETEEYNHSIIQLRIGNRTFDMHQSRNCGVCMHPARYQIEEKMLLNYGYPSIVKFVSEGYRIRDDGSREEWPKLTRIQLLDHRNNGHCPMNSEVFQALAERRAEAEGIKLEEYTGRFVDHVVAQQVVLATGMELLVRGEIQPDVKDVLAASKMMSDLEAAKTTGTSEEEFMEVMSVYFSVVRKTVEPGVWNQIIAEISDNETIVAMMKKLNAKRQEIEA